MNLCETFICGAADESALVNLDGIIFPTEFLSQGK
jgi:hypothetical protein